MVATVNHRKCARAARAPAATRGVQLVTRRRGEQILDRESRRSLGISGREFVRRYRAGETADLDRSDVARLAMLIPLAER